MAAAVAIGLMKALSHFHSKWLDLIRANSASFTQLIHWGTLAMARRQYVYSLRRRGKPTYIGKTTSPIRRAAQHRRDGKTGTMRVERSFSSDRAARRSEASRLFHFRRKHGRNPRHNKTDSGGWLR